MLLEERFCYSGEDAEEEHIDSEKFEELYSGVEFKDPKKTLRGYYEREGSTTVVIDLYSTLRNLIQGYSLIFS